MEDLPVEITRRFKKEHREYIQFGLLKEKEQEEFIVSRYGKLRKNKHYDTIDWETDEILVELKNRKCYYNTYETTMVGFNKIEYAMQDNRPCYFLFGFLDGSLWEWELDKSKTYMGETRPEFVGNGTNTSFKKDKLNYYVPMTELKELIKPNPLLLPKPKEKLPTGCLFKFKKKT